MATNPFKGSATVCLIVFSLFLNSASAETRHRIATLTGPPEFGAVSVLQPDGSLALPAVLIPGDYVFAVFLQLDFISTGGDFGSGSESLAMRLVFDDPDRITPGVLCGAQVGAAASCGGVGFNDQDFSEFLTDSIRAIFSCNDFNGNSANAISNESWSVTESAISVSASLQVMANPGGPVPIATAQTNCDITINFSVLGEIGETTGVGFEPLAVSDINLDGCVDTADLGILIAAFGTAGPDGDINLDGIVDTADLGLLIAEFSDGCP